jgi:hypothetical protein
MRSWSAGGGNVVTVSPGDKIRIVVLSPSRAFGPGNPVHFDFVAIVYPDSPAAHDYITWRRPKPG